jgi:hypothetical protein
MLAFKNDFWYKLNSEMAVKLSLPNLSSESNITYIRWSYNGQTISYAVDLYQKRDSTFEGFLTMYTEERVYSSKELPTHRIYTRRIQLDSVQVDKLNYGLQTSGIMKLPTDSLISGWVQGFDGVIYCLESMGFKSHTFKTFWSPDAQQNIQEGRLVQSFAEYIALIVCLNSIQTQFAKEIPYESYSTGGPSVALRILTSEQRRKYKKDRNLYRKKHAGKLKLNY